MVPGEWGQLMRVLQVTNMYPTPKRPSSGTFVKNEVESLRKEGIEVDVLFMDGRRNSLHYLWGIPRFWARLLTRRYDLIHAHYVFCGFISRMQFLYPVVLTHHRPGVVTSWETPLCRIVNHLVDRVIDRSLEIKQSPGFGMAEVIPAGIDFDMFKPMTREECRTALGLPMDKKLVLWAGENRRREKRLDIVTQAIARLQRAVPEAELLLVTNKPHSMVALYMNACDALLLASDGEGSPNVVKEAMACNLPVVSTPVGDVPEVIGGTEGCYLSSQDPQDLADKLELVLRWGKRTNGRDNVKHLELGAIARRLISLYQAVIREKRGKRLARLWIWQGKYQDIRGEAGKRPGGTPSITS
jgi:glycosyltransferase involved in cell wall biosynthesis